MAVFEAADLPNILSFMRYILSIPASTGYAERIFSKMTNKWSNIRNRCKVELIKRELLITLNFDHSCSDFHNVALKDKELLFAARSARKNAWRKN